MLAASILCLALQSSSASARLDQPAVLHVFVEDEAGMLLVDGWSVRRGRLSGTNVEWFETRPVHATSGVAVFAESDEPTTFVQALHDTGEVSNYELVALGPAGDGTAAFVHRLVFKGPSPERSLFVELQGLAGLVADEALALVAIDRTGGEVALQRDPEAPARYVARDVAPGGYRIELRDVRYRPVLLERHTTGTVATMQPLGSATLVVTFVDAVDGGALTPTEVISMTGVISGNGSSTMMIAGLPNRATSVGQFGEARFEGLVPGTTTPLFAMFPRHTAVSFDVAELTPGETRHVTCRAERARAVCGMIRDPNGAPVEGVTLLVDGATRVGWSSSAVPNVVGGRGVVIFGARATAVSNGSGQVMHINRLVLASSSASGSTCTSDAAGRFELYGLAPDATQLNLSYTPWHRESIPLPSLATSPSSAMLEEHAAAEGSPASPLVLRAPGPCGADIEFVMPWGMTLAHFELALRLGDGPWLRSKDATGPLVDDRQTMRLRGLPAAQCQLVVWLRGRDTVVPLASDQGSPSEAFEFVTTAGTPTSVRIDLGALARND